MNDMSSWEDFLSEHDITDPVELVEFRAFLQNAGITNVEMIGDATLLEKLYDMYVEDKEEEGNEDGTEL